MTTSNRPPTPPVPGHRAALIALAVPMTSARGATPNITLNKVLVVSSRRPRSRTPATGRAAVPRRAAGCGRALRRHAHDFMDIRSIVDHETGGERGLLGLAFHPNFETNRGCTCTTRGPAATSFVARYPRTRAERRAHRPAGPSCSSSTVPSPTTTAGRWPSARTVPVHRRPVTAAARGDPRQRPEQDPNLLGKILRINVNGTGAGPYDRYSIPPTNPFRRRDRGPRRDLGLRPAQSVADLLRPRQTGTLFIADVGQGRCEEINREPAGFAGGRNYGWNVMEGKHCFRPSTAAPWPATCCRSPSTRTPIGNCSITGGFVYRGPDVPRLRPGTSSPTSAAGGSGRCAAGGSTLILRRTVAVEHHVVRGERGRRALSRDDRRPASSGCARPR